jgi:SAM-dependent methyltransferase
VDKTPETDEQTTLWNGTAGRAWVDNRDVLERLFQPLEQLLVDAVDAGHRVLDVGCGTGATTLAAARRVGAAGRAIGVDLSEPMIAVAQARAAEERLPVEFFAANAQDHPFEPGSLDMILSRFGVMFFADPVQAFANLRRAAADAATLRCMVWRSAAENPFMTTAERAAAPMLPELPPRPQDGPGQFAFADPGRVSAILGASGWDDVAITPLDIELALPERDLVRYLTRLGPVGLVLEGADDATRQRVIDIVRTAFDPYVFGAEVRFNAACWIVSARAGVQPATRA